MDNMIVKSRKEKLHKIHITIVFNCVHLFNMRLILEKFALRVNNCMFLDFYLTKKRH